MALESGNSEPILTEPAVFMGSTVTGFNASVGWGSETSNCQIELVDDPLNPNGNFFQPPEPGTACVFAFGANDNSAHEMDGGNRSDIFRFGGILQQWTKRESTSGNTYQVVLATPTAALEGSQVILNSYQGITNYVQNVFNPFGVREFYDPYVNYNAYFGKADTNSAGYRWDMLLEDLVTLINTEYLGGYFGGQYIKYSESKFTLDLSELVALTDWLSGYRVAGTNNSILAIVDDVCKAGSCDFIVDMRGGEPDPHTGICASEPNIFVRIAPRRSLPTLGVIEGFVESAKEEGIVESADIGRELGDNVTAKLVLGGPQSRYWNGAYSGPLGGGNILPIWYTSDAGAIMTGTSYAPADVAPVRLPNGGVYYATILELRCAMASKHAWESYIAMFHPQKNWPSAVRKMDANLKNLLKNNKANPNDWVNTSRKNAMLLASVHYANRLHEYIDIVFNAIKSTADTYYGKKFLVPLPMEIGGIRNNVKFTSEDMDFTTSWEIAQSAWVENRSIFDIAFYDGEGKLNATVSYPIMGNSDYSQLGSDYTFANGYVVGKGITVSDKITWFMGQPYAIVEVPQVTVVTNDTRMDGLWSMAYYYGGVTGAPDQKANAGAGSKSTNFKLPAPAIFPATVGIPQESTRYVYGPWYAVGDDKGKVDVEYDTNLRPETFGSSRGMDNVAITKALIGSVNLQTSETGSLSLAQIPKFSLGDRFEGSGPYVTSMDVKAATGGFTTSYSFETWTLDFGKIAKYNIDRISNINKNSIRVMQEMRKTVKNPPLPSLKPKELNKNNKAGKKGIGDAGGLAGCWAVMQFTNRMSPPQLMGAMEAPQSVVQHAAIDWPNKAISDLGGLFSPVMIGKDYNNSKPGFEPPMNNEFVEGGRFSDGGNVMPTVKELDPFWSHGHKHDFTAVARDPAMPEDMQKNHDPNNGLAQQEYRPIALRGPLMLSGWGYDLYDHPTPRDSYSSTEFSEGENNTSHKEWRSMWRSGPVDLAWDEFRKVWTTRLPMKEGLITKADNPDGVAKPTSPSEGTTAKMQIWDTANSWENTDQKITLTNRDPTLEVKWDEVGADSVYAMAVYINYEWRPIWVGCGKQTEENGLTYEEMVETSSSGNTTPSISAVSPGGSSYDG